MANWWSGEDTGTSPRMAYRPPTEPYNGPLDNFLAPLNISVPFRRGNFLNDWKKWEKEKKAYDQDYQKRKAKLRAQSLANKAKIEANKSKPKPSPTPSPKPSPKPSPTPNKPGVVPKTTQTYPVYKPGNKATYGR